MLTRVARAGVPGRPNAAHLAVFVFVVVFVFVFVFVFV